MPPSLSEVLASTVFSGWLITTAVKKTVAWRHLRLIYWIYKRQMVSVRKAMMKWVRIELVASSSRMCLLQIQHKFLSIIRVETHENGKKNRSHNRELVILILTLNDTKSHVWIDKHAKFLPLLLYDPWNGQEVQENRKKHEWFFRDSTSHARLKASRRRSYRRPGTTNGRKAWNAHRLYGQIYIEIDWVEIDKVKWVLGFKSEMLRTV